MQLYTEEEMKVNNKAVRFSDNVDEIERKKRVLTADEVAARQPLDTESTDVIVVTVNSAGFDNGNFAEIMINNELVDIEENENEHERGLHIAIINPLKGGKVEFAQIFDTYRSSEALDKFIDSNKLPDGIIVAAACQDDCVTKLSQNAREWFKWMGSTEIDYVKYR